MITKAAVYVKKEHLESKAEALNVVAQSRLQ